MSEEFLKYHDEDILPDLKETENAFLVEDDDVIKGGISIFKLVGIGWGINTVKGSAKVWLELAGEKVRTVYLDKNKLCNTLAANVIAAKASIEVCINWNEKKLNAKGKACYNKFFGWKCASFNKTLVSW